jgi:hypothetical protein
LISGWLRLCAEDYFGRCIWLLIHAGLVL